jgi:hypothetical protein
MINILLINSFAHARYANTATTFLMAPTAAQIVSTKVLPLDSAPLIKGLD